MKSHKENKDIRLLLKESVFTLEEWMRILPIRLIDSNGPSYQSPKRQEQIELSPNEKHNISKLSLEKRKEKQKDQYRWFLVAKHTTLISPVEIEVEFELSSLSDIEKYITTKLERQLYVQKHLDKYHSLTSREQEILKLVVNGMSSKKIADVLSISYKTVDQHRKNIYRKLETINPYEIYRFAKFFNLINV